jgi:hypothetical protein
MVMLWGMLYIANMAVAMAISGKLPLNVSLAPPPLNP